MPRNNCKFWLKVSVIPGFLARSACLWERSMKSFFGSERVAASSVLFDAICPRAYTAATFYVARITKVTR
jgi:hypothetical protein